MTLADFRPINIRGFAFDVLAAVYPAPEGIMADNFFRPDLAHTTAPTSRDASEQPTTTHPVSAPSASDARRKAPVAVQAVAVHAGKAKAERYLRTRVPNQTPTWYAQRVEEVILDTRAHLSLIERQIIAVYRAAKSASYIEQGYTGQGEVR